MRLVDMDERRERLLARLEGARNALLSTVEMLDEGQLEAETPNPGWTVKDVIAHLASAERGHQQVVRMLLAGQDPRPWEFDLDAFNEAQVGLRRTDELAALLIELEINRRDTLALLESVGPDDWDKAGFHPGGFDTTVEGTFRVIAIHERRHLRDIQAALRTES